MSEYRRNFLNQLGPGRYPSHNEIKPPAPKGPGDSLVLTRMNIEPGQIVKIDATKNDGWMFGPYFDPEHLVFVGSPDLWILIASNIRAITLFGVDVPCDSFRPGCPTDVHWRMFSCVGPDQLALSIANRSANNVGNFIARLAGRFGEP